VVEEKRMLGATLVLDVDGPGEPGVVVAFVGRLAVGGLPNGNVRYIT
jgi:hypothetical protein